MKIMTKRIPILALALVLGACGGNSNGSEGSGGSAGTGGTGAAGSGGVGAGGTAGADAGVCPVDFAAALDTACPTEGQSCGGENCTDSCRFCNLLMCSGGKWERLEAFPDPNCGDSGSGDCGGLVGKQCAADEWCDLPDGCGSPDALGVCKKRPQGCTADCPGVCGCDGEFYCNTCGANAVGVDTSADASCSAE